MLIDNTYKKYESYTVEELLQDDFFIESINHPTPETDRFWIKAIEKEVISLYDYKLARYYIQSVHPPKDLMGKEEEFDLWNRIAEANKENIINNKKKKFKLLVISLSGVAALLALIFALNITSRISEKEIRQAGIETIQAPSSATSNDIQLILADNETISLDGKEADITYTKEGIAINNEETQLSNYTTGHSVTYNQLIVPFGKRSMLTLAEGTKIWVNAGTRVVYPVSFDEKSREIYIDGEAYLDVQKDPERPFIVKTKNMSVNVLGTSFNIMAYEKDTIQNVVLVEGAVKINSSDKELLLSPNEMCEWINGEQHIKNVNVEDYISWKSGIYKYESERLGIIVKRLSRYYGENIECGPVASQLACSGKLDLKDDLRQVLRGITHTAPVVYAYEGNTHFITNK